MRISGRKRKDILAAGRQIQIGVDDGEDAFFLHQEEETRGDDVDAGEGEGLEVRRRAHDFLLLQDLAAAEAELAVEQQLAGTMATLNRQRGQRLLFFVEFSHAMKINRTDYVNTVKNEWLFAVFGILEEEPGGFFEAAAG